MKYTTKETDVKGLNSIVQRYGFDNYKDAGVTSVPSGDFNLIREGDVIDIPNANESKFIEEKNTVGYANTDGINFKASELNTSLEKEKSQIENPAQVENTAKETPEVKISDTGRVVVGDDEGSNIISQWESDNIVKEQEWEKNQRSNYDTMFKKINSNLTEAKVSSLERISALFDQRIEEQKRINKSQLDTKKAYGLRNKGGKALYAPLMFKDVITNQEEKNADKIVEINKDMENMIAEAEQAYNEGNIELMRNKLDKHLKLKTNLNDSIDDIESQADRSYKLLKEYRQAKEEEIEKQREEDVTEMTAKLISISSKISGMSQSERYVKAQELVNETGMDLADILTAMQNAITKDYDLQLQKQKLETEKANTSQKWYNVENIKNTIFNRNRTTEAKLNDNKTTETKTSITQVEDDIWGQL